jgi:signal transduction histidine kinase
MTLSRRFALTGALAVLVPLLAFGGIALQTLRTATRQSVGEGIAALTLRTASQMDSWLSRTARTVAAMAAELEGTHLTTAQQERVLRNYLLAFPEFQQITLFDEQGRPMASTRLSLDGLTLPPQGDRVARAVTISPISLDDALLPLVTITVDLASEGGTHHLVAALELEELWRVVDTLRVGQRGHALLADAKGRLLAHGDPAQQARVARGEDITRHPLVGVLAECAANWGEYRSEDGVDYLASMAVVPSTGWRLFVEQPTQEAYAPTTSLRGVLIVATVLALATTILFGVAVGRSLLEPIGTLVDGTAALAAGDLETRVSLSRDDEFRRLADGFNRMADRLTDLQRETRRQERQAMLGRIASGLVHDLAHPVQNIVNGARLLLRQPGDDGYRDVFRRALERENAAIRRVLDDLRQLSRPAPLERFTLDVCRHLRDSVESARPAAESAGVTLRCEANAPVPVTGDAFALGRVWRNLLQNAIEAVGEGGHVDVRVDVEDTRAVVRVHDNGPGIAPEHLPYLFDEYATTKRRGLGLGLAISKRVVEQLDGTIGASNAPGGGAVFEVRLPLAPERRAAARPWPPDVQTTGADRPSHS